MCKDINFEKVNSIICKSNKKVLYLFCIFYDIRKCMLINIQLFKLSVQTNQLVIRYS